MTAADRAVAITVGALAVFGWLPRLSGPIDLRWDGGAYYALGTALAQGSGYRLLTDPGAPISTLHPPLLPALIAALQLALGTSDPMVVGHALRLSACAVFAIYIVAVYALLRTRLPVSAAFLGSLMCLLNDRTTFLSDLCFPEIPYALASVASVWASESCRGRARDFASYTLAAGAYALRTVGLALLAAWVAESVLERRPRRAAARLVAAAIPVLGWYLYIHSVEAQSEYAKPAYAYQRAAYVYYNVSYARNMAFVDPFAPERGRITPAGFARRSVEHLGRMPTVLGEAVSSAPWLWGQKLPTLGGRLPPIRLPSWPGTLVTLTLSGLIVAGLVVQLRSRRLLVPLYVMAYVALVCATPWPGQFSRYLVPLAPFLVLCLFLGLLAVAGRLQRALPGNWRAAPRYAFAAALLLALAQASYARYSTFGYSHPRVVHESAGPGYRLFYYDEIYRDLDVGLSWLRKTIGDRRAIACASDPFWVSLRTGLHTVMPPFEVDPAKAQELLDDVPVRYVILDNFHTGVRRYAKAVVEQYPARWKRVFSVGGGRVEIYERQQTEGGVSLEAPSHARAARPLPELLTPPGAR
jgi:hypothetical protein